MAIRIPDNLMNRPNVPGGMSDGTENVTRAFGNRIEQFSGYQDVQRGFGGVANESAGLENRAAAQAAEQVTASVSDTLQYVENIKLADEDSRQKSLFLKIEAQSQELRKALRADPNLAGQSEDVQQTAYEVQRDLMIDKLVQSESFSQPKIKRLVKQNSELFRQQDSVDYNQRVLIPQMVEARKLRDTEDVGSIVGTAMAQQSPEATSKAVGLIQQRYRSPEAYATYGAVNAQAYEANAMEMLRKGIGDSFLKQADDIFADATNKFGLTGIVDREALTNGPLATVIADQLLKLELNMVNAGASEGERLIARENYQKTLQQAGRAAIATHNEAYKTARKEQLEQQESMITMMGDSLFIRASSGGVTDTMINKSVTATLRGLGIDPVAASEGKLTDPDQIKLYHKVVTQVARVNSEQKAYEREQKRLASDRLTRQTLSELRVDNGIAISAGSAESLWQRNGTLKSFIEGGNKLTATHLQAIEKAGAVPTSVIGSIQQDLRSSNPQIQARGVENLRAIKSYSAKAQGALYRDLPDDFAGVINRLDNGWSTPEALSFLTRPRNTPDAEKKLKSEALRAPNLKVAESAMKDADLSPSNMSNAMKDSLNVQWADAYARAGGDTKLARDLFKQDLAKNRNVGVSGFTGKVEQYPITRFAPKETITTLINNDFPETKGKEVIPVYSGLKRSGNEEVPTYDIYVKEDGVLTRVTNEQRQFYTTREEVVGLIEKQRDAEIEKAVKAGLERKAEAQRIIDKLNSRGGVGNIRNSQIFTPVEPIRTTR